MKIIAKNGVQQIIESESEIKAYRAESWTGEYKGRPTAKVAGETMCRFGQYKRDGVHRLWLDFDNGIYVLSLVCDCSASCKHSMALWSGESWETAEAMMDAGVEFLGSLKANMEHGTKPTVQHCIQ